MLENKIKELIDKGIAVILFDRWFSDINCSYVIVENEKSTACHNLNYQKLLQNIGFVTLESTQNQMLDRLKGYQKVKEETDFSIISSNCHFTMNLP